jgi:hypothetical protein
MSIVGCMVLAALIASGPKTAPASVPAPDPVKDCPRGLVCFTPTEIGEIDVKLILLERDLKIAKARGKRFGFTAGCGPGIAGRIVNDETTLDAAIVCGVVWGPHF